MKRRLSSNGGSESARPSSSKDLLKLVSLIRPYRGQFSAGLVALFAGSGINLLFPEVARRVLDPSFFPTVLQNLGVLTGGLGALFIIQAGAFYARSYLFGIVGQRVYADVREKIFAAVIGRDPVFFDANRSGYLASRLNSDAALVQDAVSLKLSIILRYGVQVILGVVLMAWMSWRMTAAIMVSVLSMVIVSRVFVQNLRRASKDYQRTLARLTAFAAECFGGAKIIKALAAQSEVKGQFNDLNQEVMGAARRRVRSSSSFSSGASLLLNLLLLLVQWYGIHLVVTQELPLNDLAAFVLYGAIVAVSFTFLVSAYAELMQSVGGLERVFELIDHEPKATSSGAPVSLENSKHSGVEVALDEVTFSYPQRPDTKVLDRVSLRLARGQMTAIVGPSGSGKSSIVQLLLAFYSPESGRVSLDGEDVSTISEGDLRNILAWVPQEPYLFGFSVFQNLILGNRSHSREEIEQLVREWKFLDFIANLPEGLDTVLGEQGTQLSGGQRQRIAIARALLRRPSLLILDEATSGLDSETEDLVMTVVRDWLPSATVLIISHRLATVRAADTVYVLNEGRVSEQGTHQELRAANGIYQQYVERQALD